MRFYNQFGQAIAITAVAAQIGALGLEIKTTGEVELPSAQECYIEEIDRQECAIIINGNPALLLPTVTTSDVAILLDFALRGETLVTAPPGNQGEDETA